MEPDTNILLTASSTPQQSPSFYSTNSSYLSIETITPQDLFELTNNLATLNLAYLGVSLTAALAVIGILGTVFVIFNFRPLKESLVKQEKEINDLKKEASSLLDLSKAQSIELIESYKEEQRTILQESLTAQKETIKLETENIIQNTQKVLTEKIYEIAEEKDLSVKEVLRAEIINAVSALEKSLTEKLTEIDKKIEVNANETKKIGVNLKDLKFKVRELEAYKYHGQGKMGGIIITLDLLKTEIDTYLKITNQELRDIKRYRIENKIEELIEYIGDFIVKKEYRDKIKAQIERIRSEKELQFLIKKLEEKIKDEDAEEE